MILIYPIKPDWKNAPEWANWLALNEDGTWIWHEEKPEPSLDLEWEWYSEGETLIAQENIFDWRNSLEQRDFSKFEK